MKGVAGTAGENGLSVERVTRGPAVPLAWFESYLAVYKHRDYAAAGGECGRTSNVVEDHVNSLQSWLGLLLIGGGTPLQIVDENAVKVAPLAEEVLRLAEQALADVQGRSQAIDLALTRSSRSDITIFQLRVLSVIARSGNVATAADTANCDITTARRQMRRFEEIAGCRLVYGINLSKITQSGIRMADAAKAILMLLDQARFIGTEADRELAHQQNRQRQLFVDLIPARRDLRTAEGWKRLTPQKRAQKKQLVEHRKRLQREYDKLCEDIGPIPKEEAADLHLSTLVKSLPKGVTPEDFLARIANIFKDSDH